MRQLHPRSTGRPLLRRGQKNLGGCKRSTLVDLSLRLRIPRGFCGGIKSAGCLLVYRGEQIAIGTLNSCRLTLTTSTRLGIPLWTQHSASVCPFLAFSAFLPSLALYPALDCRVCVKSMKRGAVHCSRCFLTAHAKCTARAPAGCYL